MVNRHFSASVLIAVCNHDIELKLQVNVVEMELPKKNVIEPFEANQSFVDSSIQFQRCHEAFDPPPPSRGRRCVS